MDGARWRGSTAFIPKDSRWLGGNWICAVADNGGRWVPGVHLQSPRTAGSWRSRTVGARRSSLWTVDARRAATVPPAMEHKAPAAAHCLSYTPPLTKLSPAATAMAPPPSGSASQLAAGLGLGCSVLRALALENLPPMGSFWCFITLQPQNQTKPVICYLVTDSRAF
jgi:hypothetical protein